MLALEGEGHDEWFEGKYEDYDADKIRWLGPDAVEPKRINRGEGHDAKGDSLDDCQRGLYLFQCPTRNSNQFR